MRREVGMAALGINARPIEAGRRLESRLDALRASMPRSPRGGIKTRPKASTRRNTYGAGYW